jgi:hypothetical protein
MKQTNDLPFGKEGVQVAHAVEFLHCRQRCSATSVRQNSHLRKRFEDAPFSPDFAKINRKPHALGIRMTLRA